MIRIFITTLLFLFPVLSFGQDSTAVYWFKFADKQGTPYEISQPSEFLSQKAIKRRKNQGISINKRDLPVNPDYVDQLGSHVQEVLLTSKWMNGAAAHLKDSGQLAQARQLSFIDTGFRIKGNYLQTNSIGNSVPNLPMYYGVSGHQIEMLNGHLLHHRGLKGQGVGIAVLDAGFSEVDELDAFEHLHTFDLIKGTWDFISQDKAVYGYSYHGMMVLSLMAGYLEQNLMGTAPLANYWLLRSENVNSEFIIEEYSWIAAAEYVDSVGAKIINSSLGYTTFDDSTTNHSYKSLDGNTTPVTRAADIAAQKGILVVSSAGNQGGGSWQYISAPADADSILTVGAVDSTRDITFFSSRGPTYDGRIKPEVVAQGQKVFTASSSDDQLYQGAGTSFAAPLVAGMAACLWQKFPQATNMEIREAIIQSASQYQNPDTIKGYGIPNFYQAYISLNEKLNSEQPENHVVSLYPNPFKNKINFDFYSINANAYQVSLMDMTGRIVSSKSVLLQKGLNSFEFTDLHNVSSGLYFLTIKSNEVNISKKIIKY